MIVASLLLIFAAVVLLVVGVAGHSDAALIGSIVGTLMAVVVLIGSARRAATVRLAAASADGPGLNPTVHSGPSSGMVIDGTVVERPTARSAGRTASAPTASTATEAVPDGTVLLDEVDEDAQTATIPTQQRPPVDPTLADPAPVDLDSGDGGDLDDGDLDDGVLDGGDDSDAAEADDGLAADDLRDFEEEDPPDEPPAQLISPSDQALIAGLETHVLVVDGRPRYHLSRCPHLRGRETEPLPVREAVELGFTPCGRCEPATVLLLGARPT